MLDRMRKKDPTGLLLVDEFVACRSKVITMCHSGAITLVTRKSKRDKIKGDLANVRKQVMEAIEQTGRNNSTDYNIQTLAVYKEKNSNACPKKAGEVTGFEFHEGRVQEVVYLRVQ